MPEYRPANSEYVCPIMSRPVATQNGIEFFKVYCLGDECRKYIDGICFPVTVTRIRRE